MVNTTCRFCGIRISLDQSASSAAGLVCLGTDLAHRACVFNESQDRESGGWHRLTVEEIANFSRAAM